MLPPFIVALLPIASSQRNATQVNTTQHLRLQQHSVQEA
jgi:hypothetical protein